jgi:hypothetical protein
VKGLLHKQQGDIWSAAWESCLAEYSAATPDIKSVNQFALGQRQHRLGYMESALENYFLVRSKAGQFARLVQNRYTQRCLQISGGRSSDVLNLLRDLID